MDTLTCGYIHRQLSASCELTIEFQFRAARFKLNRSNPGRVLTKTHLALNNI